MVRTISPENAAYMQSEVYARQRRNEEGQRSPPRTEVSEDSNQQRREGEREFAPHTNAFRSSCWRALAFILIGIGVCLCFLRFRPDGGLQESYSDGGLQESHSSNVYPFIVPIIKELNANFTKVADLPVNLPAALIAIDIPEIAALKAHYKEVFRSTRLAKRSTASLTRSLTQVEGLFSSVDLHGSYDPAALSSQSLQHPALEDSIERSESTEEDLSRMQISLELVVSDIERIRTTLMKEEDYYFRHWSYPAKMDFLWLSDEPPHEVTEKREAAVALDFLESITWTRIPILADAGFMSIDMNNRLRKVQATLSMCKNTKVDETEKVKARADILDATKLIGYQEPAFMA